MKVILTGATGFVGSEVLAQLISRSDITGITCLSRRPVAVDSPKVNTILHSDFAAYDLDLVKHLAEHSACIWTLGGKASDYPDAKEFERITYTFTLNFAQTVAENLTYPLRFCYLSGMGADPSESTWLPWEKPTRYLKGRSERELARLTERHALFYATSFRPGGILPKSTSAIIDSLLAPLAIRVDRLAKAMIDRAANTRSQHYRVLLNRPIRKMASLP